jgi:WD40 repeat protein
VSIFYDTAAHLLRIEDAGEVRRLAVEREAAAVAFSPDGRLAAVGSELGAIALFTLASEAEPHLLAGTGRSVRQLLFVGDRLLSAADDGVLGVWDSQRGALLTNVPAAGVYPHLAPSPGGRLVASAGAAGVVLLHEVATGAVVERLAWHGSQVLALAWADRVLATGDADGHVALWDVGDVVR